MLQASLILEGIWDNPRCRKCLNTEDVMSLVFCHNQNTSAISTGEWRKWPSCYDWFCQSVLKNKRNPCIATSNFRKLREMFEIWRLKNLKSVNIDTVPYLLSIGLSIINSFMINECRLNPSYTEPLSFQLKQIFKQLRSSLKCSTVQYLWTVSISIPVRK